MCVELCLQWAKEEIEREWEKERGRENEMESERKDRERVSTQVEGGSFNGPYNRGRVGLTLNLYELLWPSMTFEVILMRLYNVNIHIIFYQNRFLNECARKIKAKIPESQSFTVSECQIFLWDVKEFTFLIKPRFSKN